MLFLLVWAWKWLEIKNLRNFKDTLRICKLVELVWGENRFQMSFLEHLWRIYAIFASMTLKMTWPEIKNLQKCLENNLKMTCLKIMLDIQVQWLFLRQPQIKSHFLSFVAVNFDIYSLWVCKKLCWELFSAIKPGVTFQQYSFSVSIKDILLKWDTWFYCGKEFSP